MRRRSIFFALLLAFCALWRLVPQPVSAQEVTATPTPVGTELSGTVMPVSVGFSSLQDGAVLFGVVDISGTTLSAWDLSFSYADDLTGTWFALSQSADPVSEGLLISWDTTVISDGFYVLRLRFLAADGMQEYKLHVRVQNSALLEPATAELTPTATKTQFFPQEAPAVATSTVAPSPTVSPPFPTNPAELDTQDILIYLGKGVLAVVIVFVFAGFIFSLRHKNS